MKVIFLDIDWALTTKESKLKHFVTEAVIILKEIINETWAQLVICSSWKYARYEELFLQFQLHKIPMWIDTTKKSFWTKRMRREDEILQWVEWNKPTHWLVIDDCYFEMPKIKELNKIIQPNSLVWLTYLDLNKAVEILGWPIDLSLIEL